MHQVLLEQGFKLDVKVIRKLTYRYAARARVLQQMGQILYAEEETLDGRLTGKMGMRPSKEVFAQLLGSASCEQPA